MSESIFDMAKMFDDSTASWVKRHLEKFPFPKDLQIATNFVATGYDPDSVEPEAVLPYESREIELSSKLDISRFWDWESFCVADRNGCGIMLIGLRARRVNVSIFHFWSNIDRLPIHFRSISGALPVHSRSNFAYFNYIINIFVYFRMIHPFHPENMTVLRRMPGAIDCSLVWFTSDGLQTLSRTFL